MAGWSKRRALCYHCVPHHVQSRIATMTPSRSGGPGPMPASDRVHVVQQSVEMQIGRVPEVMTKMRKKIATVNVEECWSFPLLQISEEASALLFLILILVRGCKPMLSNLRDLSFTLVDRQPNEPHSCPSARSNVSFPTSEDFRMHQHLVVLRCSPGTPCERRSLHFKDYHGISTHRLVLFEIYIYRVMVWL